MPISNDLTHHLTSCEEHLHNYADGYISGLFNHGIINIITAEKLHKMFLNPDHYQEELEKLAHYFYITSAEVHQLFEMVEVLPRLNFRIEMFDKDDKSDKYVKMFVKHMRKIKHKRLTRDILKQLTSSGNVCGIWLGDAKAPFPYVFDNTRHVFPVGRNEFGEWITVMDLSWFDSMTDAQRDMFFKMFESIDIEEEYKKYRKSYDYKYLTLPVERTFSLITGKLHRNQTVGTSWVTSGLLDVLHKKKLKDVEQSIANKIINAIAVLTIGSEKNPDFANMKINKTIKQKIHHGVKKALRKREFGGVTVVTVPEYASIDFPEINTDGLNGDKFDPINSDIKAAYGLSGAMTNGENANYAVAKQTLDIFYLRLAVILEDIEDEIFGKMFNLMVNSKYQDNFYIEYDKEAPLTLKEKIDYVKSLNDKGWSSKHLIEMIGLDFEQYLEQTLWETEEQKLQERIRPYLTSYTSNADDIENNGRPSVDDSDVKNENTIRSRESAY